MKSYVTSIVEEISECSKEVSARMLKSDDQDQDEAVMELKAKLRELWNKLDAEVRGDKRTAAQA